jgi:ABC-type Fe3+ transport system permease subunit
MLISRGAQYWQTEISKTVVSRESFCFFVSIFETVRKTNKLKRKITKERKIIEKMELWGQKIFVCLLFIIFPILFGLVLPYFSMRKHLRNRTLPKWYGPVNSMSIGLLFGVLLLHLIPGKFLFKPLHYAILYNLY